jgi:hypothetical protein
MDKINDKYGEFVITLALMMGMDDTIMTGLPLGKGSAKTMRLCRKVQRLGFILP